MARTAGPFLRLDYHQRAEQGLGNSASLYQDCGEELGVAASELLVDSDATQEHYIAPCINETTERLTISRPEPRRIIGPYRLLEQIGEGGMGSVWLAEQELPVRRRVALKLIRADLGSRETIARFEAERQALAMMDHQNIAKVLDAGTTDDGSPYFVMELVKGIPFTDYCDRNKLNVEDRLRLFIPICNAVQHAHQKGIIHRDLKPSNVLVTLYDGKPVPKVIDFGLAKATEHTTKLTDKTMYTEFGKVVGTLQYMAPEQAEMNALDVDTRTDVYALGVMLYEILTGSTPLDRETIGKHALLQILTIILEKEPPRPSARLSSSGDAITGISEQRKITPSKLRQILRGELDWIVMKALEKDRTRRYDSASSMAMDVERFLNNEVVAARPPSSTYRLKKQISQLTRNPLAASLAGIFLSVCILGPLTVVWISHNARVVKQTAEANRLLELLQDDDTSKVNATIDALEPYWGVVEPQVQALQQSTNPKTQLHATLARARYGVTDIDVLKTRLLLGLPDEVSVIARAIGKSHASLKDEFWGIIANGNTNTSIQRQQLLGAAAFLAEFDATSSSWNTAAEQMAQAIIASQSFEEISAWQQVFQPVGPALTEGILSAFDQSLRNKDKVLATRAAELLASYSTDNQLLANLLTRCDAQAFEVVINRLSKNPLVAKVALQQTLRETPRQKVLRERRSRHSPTIRADLQTRLQTAQGFANVDFAYCQALPANQFDTLNEMLEVAGFRLQKLRPYVVSIEARIAAVWIPSETTVVYAINERKTEIQSKHLEYSKQGYRAVDVAGYNSGKERFSAVWHVSDFEHTDIHLGLNSTELESLYQEYNTYIKTIHSYQKPPTILDLNSTGDFSRYSVIVSSHEGEGTGWNRPLLQLQSLARAKNLRDLSFCNSRIPVAFLEDTLRSRSPLLQLSRMTNPLIFTFVREVGRFN